MAHPTIQTSELPTSARGKNARADHPRVVDPVQLIRGWLWKMAFATLALMAVGSATRVMNAGLACPDWPLCYGQLVPSQQMNFQVFLEWFHRLDAALIGLMAVGLVGLCVRYRQHLPHGFPWAASIALIMIVFQGILGGLTVTQLLRFDIVTAHLGTALLFFCTVLALGITLIPYQPTGTVDKLPELAMGAAILVYGQSILGGLVASRWAVHQCIGLAELCQVMNSHLLGVIPPSLAVLAVFFKVWRTPALDGQLRVLAQVAGSLLLVQIALGVATWRLHLQVAPLTVAHQAVAATLLGTLVCLTCLAFRDRHSIQASVSGQLPLSEHTGVGMRNTGVGMQKTECKSLLTPDS